MQLFGANYFKPQYFNAAYLHGATAVPAQDGKSGYWKLFFYQMQEEALKPKETKDDKVPEVAVQEAEVLEDKRVDVPAKKVVRRKAPEPETPTVRERPILRKVEPVEELPNVTPFLSVISSEFRMWLNTSEPLRIAMLQKKAANDEEEEIINLLLLAA